jgi:membrane protein YqaA with SNARE-associated domain
MMNDTINSNESSGVAKEGWIKKWLIPVVMLLLVTAITITLFIYRDNVAELEEYGYLGAFLINLIANATIILPMPGQLLTFAFGASFNPLLVGLAGGFGGALGEVTGYIAGASGRVVLQDNQAYLNAVGWLKKWGVAVIFLFTVTPLPVDLIGIAAGALRYSVWKFLLVCFIGKAILYTGMAYMGAWGWDAVINQHWDTRAMRLCGLAIAVVLAVLVLALFLERWTWRRRR